MSNEKFHTLYNTISDHISSAVKEIEKLHLEHSEGKRESKNIIDSLKKIQGKFSGELSKLDKNSEWEKFSIAFFGETNAGKSTIIESLRILFNDQDRLRKISQHEKDLNEREKNLFAHANTVRDHITQLCEDYAKSIIIMHKDISSLRRIITEKIAMRTKNKMVLSAVIGFFLGGGIASFSIIYFYGII